MHTFGDSINQNAGLIEKDQILIKEIRKTTGIPKYKENMSTSSRLLSITSR